MSTINPVLSIKQMECRYDGLPVVHALNMNVTQGSLVCLLGPSGCGKTTVLRTIAGFVEPTSGSIEINNEVVSKPGYSLAPEKRKLGMVFQDHALFPHFTVEQNIAAGLTAISNAEKNRIVGELLERVGLEKMGSRYPHELSGGQQQRVAIARALAPNPSLVLMDEPFSNLDLDLRERLGNEVKDLLHDRGATCVIVTHDQYDAFSLGDLVGVMNDGEIVQWDTPYNLYHEPSCRFVAEFVGDGVLIPANLKSHDTVETELGTHVSDKVWPYAPGTALDILVRPDDIARSDDTGYSATVRRKAFKGAQILYTLRLASGRDVLALMPSHDNFSLGETLTIRLEADHLVAFQK